MIVRRSDYGLSVGENSEDEPFLDLTPMVLRKAACALANKIARICYAVLRDHTAYGNPQPRPNKKFERTAFAVAT